MPSNEWSQKSTEGREGFVHPYEFKGGVEEAEIIFIIRSFVDEDLSKYERRLEALLKEVMVDYPNSTYTFEVVEQYRNMHNVIQKHPQVSAFAYEAIERAGLAVKKGSTRGGTDGSKLSYMGLPCPNIFAGEHAFHSKMEWVSVQDMHMAVETLVNLAVIWEERS